MLLNPGDYLTYPGDAPHVFDATMPGTSAIVTSIQRLGVSRSRYRSRACCSVFCISLMG